MTGEDTVKSGDPVQDQVAEASNGALQGALNTLAAAAVERDRILDSFREQKERLEFQLQQQRAHAMNYVEQTRAETQARTGTPDGSPSQPAESAGGLKLTPDQQMIAGIKMLIYQDTRPYEVTTEAQTQSSLLLLDALKKMIHQEINMLLERAQAQEAAAQKAAAEEAAAAEGARQQAEKQAPEAEREKGGKEDGSPPSPPSGAVPDGGS